MEVEGWVTVTCSTVPRRPSGRMVARPARLRRSRAARSVEQMCCGHHSEAVAEQREKSISEGGRRKSKVYSISSIYEK